MNHKLIAITDPSGNWEYKDLLGASVHIKSASISSGYFGASEKTVYTIESINFRVSLDGKCFTIISLKDLPGKTFTWKDLEIIELNFPSICGLFVSGSMFCGNNPGCRRIPDQTSSCCSEGEVLD